MDLNPDAAGHAAPEVTILQQDCSQPWPAEQDSLDAVFTSNFFEHLPTKSHLEQTLLQAFRVLKRGGALIAMGPNIKYAPGEYWDFYDHHIALTESSLAEVMKKCGFSIEKVTDRFLPYTMSNSKRYPLWTLRLYLLLPVIWPLFGKQFLVIARANRRADGHVGEPAVEPASRTLRTSRPESRLAGMTAGPTSPGIFFRS